MASSNQTEKKGSRREFLKTAGVGVVTAGALAVGYYSAFQQVPQLSSQLEQAQSSGLAAQSSAYQAQSTLQSSLQSALQELGSDTYLLAFNKTSVGILNVRTNKPVVSAPVPVPIDNIGTHAIPDAAGHVWGIHNDVGPYASATVQSWAYAVDPHGMVLLKQLPIGGHLNAAEPIPDGSMIIQIASAKNAANVIDPQSLSILQTIPTGAWPCDIHTPPIGKGRLAYVPNRDDDTLQEIDLDQMKVVRTAALPKGSGASMLTVSPDGKYVFIEASGQLSSQAGSSNVVGSPNETVIDLASFTTVKQIPLQDNGSPGIDNFTPDSRYCFVTTSGRNGGAISVIDVKSLSLAKTIPVQGGPSGIKMSPDGKYCYTGSANGVVAINTSTLIIDQVIPFPGGAAQFVLLNR